MQRFLYGVIIFCIAGGFIPASETNPPDSHPFSVHDLVAMERISGETVSPDGKLVVFVLRQTDLQANKGRTDLWVTGTDGKGLRRLTSDSASDSDPCWSPDSRYIYFLSTRSGSSQIWKLFLSSGEPVQLTHLPLDVSNLVLSRDGSRMAFSLDVFPGRSPNETSEILEEERKNPASGRIYSRLFVRHWDTWNDNRRSHLFVMPINGGNPIDVMKEMDADSPSKPFGDSSEFCFTPDGKSLLFFAADNGTAEAWSTNNDLFISSIDGVSPPKKVDTTSKARKTSPLFSPDGRTLAYLSMKRPGYEADRYYIVLRSWSDGRERIVAERWDRSPDSIAWSPNGKTLYAIADNLGQKSLFAIDIAKGEVKSLVQEGTVTSIGLTGAKIVFGIHHLLSPTELYVLNPVDKKRNPITTINSNLLATVKMGKPEQFSFKGWNDETVYGYVVKPVDFNPEKKYPVALLIHGGPQGSMGNDFHYRWNPQIYAGAGYGALMIDFHGSTGYGQAFTDSISCDWGGKPLEDLQKGLESALQKYPWLDGERVSALGASFGGYMINWIAGKWPERFRCLVCHDGNLDERSAYFDTEELWFPEWDHCGTPWENPEGYNKHNPVDWVKYWKTPMLVIHGALDFRVVETQGLSTFTALQRRGIPSKLLYFPDENHWVLKPHNSILWHKTVLEWLDQWTKK